ncbi:MAG TPA: response regulator, partial [Pirellulales bacterium]|nr:response regulator [Pirellulales bacterium]
MAMRLMVADADESILERCENYSSRNGIALQIAKGGIECLDALRRSPPDVLVLDIDLPWGGGDGVLTVMREDDLLAGIPVVLLDRNAASGFGPGRFPANVVGRLVKPLDVATLFDSACSAADCREAL